MDDRRFDALTRSLAAGASRRRVLKGLFGGLIGGAAFGGAQRTYAEDEGTPVPETDAAVDPVVDPVVEEAPPVDETVPEDTPPAGDTPPVGETPPAEEPPAEAPPPEPAADEGTPADPAGPLVIVCDLAAGQIACDSVCCDAGWRCCGVYCIPDREGSCCTDTECDTCEICSLDGLCFPGCEALGLECCVDEEQQIFTCAECCRDDPACEVVVDCDFCESIGQQCCVDEKHDRLTCAYCCDDFDCEGDGACARCYGGYCLSCFDQTDGRAPICAIDQCSETVTASGGSGDYCVQCCSDEQCKPCERCHDGWCEYVCDPGEHCCEVDLTAADLVNGGYCATCCGPDDCSGCERCYQGQCSYACDEDETCCHGEYCAPKEEGCCGVQGDWCEFVTAADNLNGSCCRGLQCCWDDKSHSGTCAECCDDYDCGPTPGIGGTGYCCGGVCQAECCRDTDCERGVCVEGVCHECRENHDCDNGKICCDGGCFAGYECCFENAPDPVNCGECETCFEGFCRPTGVDLYGVCNPMVVAPAWGDAPQLNCCDGLVCCDTHKYGLVCLECCSDHDCAHGCTCEEGFCSCGCASDKDCADGTCCCKNGSCSADCCPRPEPPKPHKPSTGTTTVTSLPATGIGDAKQGSNWLGAAALGAAAAYLASRKLKPEETPEAPAPEE